MLTSSPFPAVDYSVFIVPTKLEVALYRNVLSGSTVRALLEGHGKKEQLSLLTTLRKLVNTPGLLLQEAQSVCSLFSSPSSKTRADSSYHRRRAAMRWATRCSR